MKQNKKSFPHHENDSSSQALDLLVKQANQKPLKQPRHNLRVPACDALDLGSLAAIESKRPGLGTLKH